MYKGVVLELGSLSSYTDIYRILQLLEILQESMFNKHHYCHFVCACTSELLMRQHQATVMFIMLLVPVIIECVDTLYAHVLKLHQSLFPFSFIRR